MLPPNSGAAGARGGPLPAAKHDAERPAGSCGGGVDPKRPGCVIESEGAATEGAAAMPGGSCLNGVPA